MIVAVTALLDDLGWTPDLDYPTDDGSLAYFMDETDEALVKVWEDGRWAVIEYDRQVASGSGADDLRAALSRK